MYPNLGRPLPPLLRWIPSPSTCPPSPCRPRAASWRGSGNSKEIVANREKRNNLKIAITTCMFSPSLFIVPCGGEEKFESLTDGFLFLIFVDFPHLLNDAKLARERRRHRRLRMVSRC